MDKYYISEEASVEKSSVSIQHFLYFFPLPHEQMSFLSVSLTTLRHFCLIDIKIAR